jgi:hypothetical protein
MGAEFGDITEQVPEYRNVRSDGLASETTKFSTSCHSPVDVSAQRFWIGVLDRLPTQVAHHRRCQMG